MTLLSRDQILKAEDLQAETVEVSEWGGKVRVRGLTGAQRDEYEASVVDMRGRNTRINMVNARAKLVALTVVDEKGNHLFTPADVKALGAKSAKAIQRVFDVAMRLSGLSEDTIEGLTQDFG